LDGAEAVGVPGEDGVKAAAAGVGLDRGGGRAYVWAELADVIENFDGTARCNGCRCRDVRLVAFESSVTSNGLHVHTKQGSYHALTLTFYIFICILI